MARQRKAAEVAEAPRETLDVFDQAIADRQAEQPAPPPELPPILAKPEEPEKRVYPNPRSWSHDNEAGVEVSTYSNKETKTYESWIKFRDGKPSEQVRQVMKEAGFKWHPDVPKGGNFDVAGAWTHPIGYTTGNQDRYTAEKTYTAVVEMVLAEKGVGQSR